MDKNVLGWASYRGLRMKMGQWKGREWKKTKQRWYRENPEPELGHICYLCDFRIANIKQHRNHRLGPWDFTLDHVIPIDAVYEYELDVWLIFDHSNLKPAHQLCNTKKANSYTHPKLQLGPEASTSEPVLV